MHPGRRHRWAQPLLEPLEGRALLAGFLPATAPSGPSQPALASAWPAGIAAEELPGLNGRIDGDLHGRQERMYQLDIPQAGTLSAELSPAAGSLVGLRLDLVGEGGAILATSEGTSGNLLGGQIEQHLSPGRYYLAVSAQGQDAAYHLLTGFTPGLSPLAPLDTGLDPRCVAAGDLNGDGRVDLVTANRMDDTLSVFLASSVGSFLPRMDYPAGSLPAAVLIADVDGNGRPDLVCADSGNDRLTVLLGDGTGSFISGPTPSVGHAPVAMAAADLNGDGSDIANGVAVDGNGNVVLTGTFEGIVDFDPGVGTFNLTSAGSSDAFVVKLTSSGNFVWARSLGGDSFDFASAIAADGQGNVFTTGSFRDTVDFDPGPGTYNLTGLADVFVWKLTSSGTFVWARAMGNGNESGDAIAVDSLGNVYTTGHFAGTVDFDPGPGTFNLTSVPNTITAFVSKLDAAGTFVWAVRPGGLVGNGIAVDSFGNVYTTGVFTGLDDFDPGPATFNLSAGGTSDIFVSKLDTSGQFLWARKMGGPEQDGPSSIALDSAGNVYTTGAFQATSDFDPGPNSFTLSTTFNLSTQGNELWTFVSELSRTAE